jgi:hypothetical protein
MNKILKHPQNAELFKERVDTILYPGDKIFIPDKRLDIAVAPSGKRYTFCIRPIPTKRKIRMLIKNNDGQPVTLEPVRVTVEGEVIDISTNKEGYLEVMIPILAKEAELQMSGKKRILKIAYLDPVNKISGIQARLNNLGFKAGPADGINGKKTKAAVRAFQESRNIKVDGIAGPQTQRHLIDAHGC